MDGYTDLIFSISIGSDTEIFAGSGIGQMKPIQIHTHLYCAYAWLLLLTMFKTAKMFAVVVLYNKGVYI